jgi:bisanhydrobacterioruberin hydratase
MKLILKKYPFHLLFASMYLAGLIGLNIEAVRPFFLYFTPIHLFSTCVVLVYFQTQKNTSFWWFVGLSFSIGYLVEIIGVNTGLIFGEYEYETTLGFEILKTPPIIGCLWFQLSYCIGMAINDLRLNKTLKTILGATLMTALDYVVEPVAIKFDMWSWRDITPPLQNYIGWFVVSLPIFWLFYSLPFRKENKIANLILLLTCLFFMGNRILL